MALIKTTSPEEATGAVKEVYGAMQERLGFVPRPLQMLSASPDLLGIYARSMGYFGAHETLGFPLLTQIRLLAALHCDYPYCIDLNSKLLETAFGLTGEQVAALRTDAASSPLEAKDRAMLLFAVKAIRSPEDVQSGDMAELHDLGWTDRDVFDALYHGAAMVAMGIMFTAFKMGEK